ncbi:MAG: protein kinase [Candidatus Aminicenantes bacterium]|nr:protein kinase [Candidatus Aminicenantes bacterium]
MKCPKCQFETSADSRFCSNCGAPLSLSEKVSDSHTKTLQIPKGELTRGTTFAKRFEVIEELGKGGMGVVYRVVDNKVEEEVALKLLNSDVASDEETIERFRNELKFARKISHKNVCRMYDLNEDEGTQYITMEYVSGEDLKSTIIRVGQLSVGKAVSITKQVCEGLIEAHRLGVIHRDLKPQNIMIDKEGNVRIMDFGIARSLRTRGVTGTGVMIGTPEYMSPEQADVGDLDQRSDIYSLGVILYEMVTGRVPFEGDTPLNIVMKHKSEKPLDPREFNSQIPENLSRVILRCMEKNSEKRYQGADRLLSELNNIERGLPTSERVIPKRKPITARDMTVQINVKKLFLPALAFIGIIVLVVVLLQLFPKGKAVSFPTDKPSLAVMHFENNTGDENLDHWRKALSDLLIADLSQSKYIMVLSGEKLFSILEELDLLEVKNYSSRALKEIAGRGGVQYILVGKMAMAGEALRINALLQEASTGSLVGSEMVEGIGEESFFSMVDELTTKIKTNFKLSEEQIAADIDKKVGDITTSSPEAYKYYREGMGYFAKGDYLKSIPLMEMAVAIDREFAMAYRTMAIAYSNIGYSTEAGKRFQKAFELSDQVSDRERFYIQGAFYFQSEKTYDKAIEAFNKLINIYPDDFIGNNNLGFLYADLEEWDKAIALYEVNIQNKAENVKDYENIVSSYAAKGLYEKAREVLERYISDFSGNAVIHFNLANNYLHQGKYDLAQTEADKALSLDQNHYRNFILNGDIFYYREDLVNAEKEYQKLLETEEPTAHDNGIRRLAALYLLKGLYEKSKEQAQQGIELAEMLGEMKWSSQFHLYLAYLNLKSQNLEEALEACNKGWSKAVEAEILSRQREALYLKGRVYVEMKSLDGAQLTADELKELIKEGKNKKAIRLYRHLMGVIELKKKNFSKAIDHFEQALKELPSQYNPDHGQALYIEPLALAYYMAGDFDSAMGEYERIISLTTGRLYYGDIYSKSFYMLGKIYQEKGLTEKAIENYEKFLELWKEAEPDTPELVDAREQLEALQTQ